MMRRVRRASGGGTVSSAENRCDRGGLVRRKRVLRIEHGGLGADGAWAMDAVRPLHVNGTLAGEARQLAPLPRALGGALVAKIYPTPPAGGWCFFWPVCRQRRGTDGICHRSMGQTAVHMLACGHVGRGALAAGWCIDLEEGEGWAAV